MILSSLTKRRKEHAWYDQRQRVLLEQGRFVNKVCFTLRKETVKEICDVLKEREREREEY